MCTENYPYSKAEILVVDDSRTNLTYFNQLLSNNGYKVRVATNGETALKCIKSHHPDLILLDIIMPKMNGYTLCKQIKANNETRHIPVIFISYLQEIFDKVKAFTAGGVDYISKPFEPLEVLMRIENHLRLRSLQLQLMDKNTELQAEVWQRKKAEKELVQANLELKKLVNVDGLTGVANRRYFDLTLEQEWYRLKREELPLSLIMCDIDYFKQYNDYYGHVKGDQCLTTVAQTMQEVVKRSADLVARYGGEEFAVILPNTNLAGAKRVAENIRLAVQNLKMPHCRSEVSDYVSLSLGVSCIVPMLNQEMSPELLKITADRALYQAKKKGRDRIETASRELNR